MADVGIVVGYDGSEGAEQAVKWAAAEARSRGCPLTLCLAQTPAYPEPAPSAQAGPAQARKAAESALAPGLQTARGLLGAQAVHSLIATGPPAAVLTAQGADAQMVVVGAHGRDHLPGVPVGPVSLAVAAHSPGRAVVVRGACVPVPGRQGLVVVGADGSPGSEGAVVLAFEEAALRDSPLVAVCALADDPALLGTAARIKAEFEQVMSKYEQQHPEVHVRHEVSQGSARTALLDAAAGAQLLVIGARGRGGLRGMPMGSVGMAVVGYAPCPVAIARAA